MQQNLKSFQVYAAIIDTCHIIKRYSMIFRDRASSPWHHYTEKRYSMILREEAGSTRYRHEGPTQEQYSIIKEGKRKGERVRSSFLYFINTLLVCYSWVSWSLRYLPAYTSTTFTAAMLKRQLLREAITEKSNLSCENHNLTASNLELQVHWLIGQSGWSHSSDREE